MLGESVANHTTHGRALDFGNGSSLISESVIDAQSQVLHIGLSRHSLFLESDVTLGVAAGCRDSKISRWLSVAFGRSTSPKVVSARQVRSVTDMGRVIDLSVEVIGDVETVWRAVATGPGISSWWLPHTLKGRTGEAVIALFGPEHAMQIPDRVADWASRRCQLLATDSTWAWTT